MWEAIRVDYLAGMSAPEVCRRHGVGLRTLRVRAAREQWRRADQPWASPVRPLDVDDEGLTLEKRTGGDLDRVALHELIWVAERRMIRAVLRGDAAEAMRWRRMRLAMSQDEAASRALDEHDEAFTVEEVIDFSLSADPGD